MNIVRSSRKVVFLLLSLLLLASLIGWLTVTIIDQQPELTKDFFITPSPSDISPTVKPAESDTDLPLVPTATVFLPATFPTRTPTAVQPQSTTLVFPEISDSSIIQALNQYRADHQVHQLVEDQHLCQYAQKRVNELVELGKLDNHEGFKRDFASFESLPEEIKNYSGGKIAENLAYQHCRNMTTGESFIAQTAVALIEWCFDSSTAGHREAQLNSSFNAVCARHNQGFFVVIFGE